MSEFIFDIHTHAFPERIARTTMEKLSEIASEPYHGDGTIAALREELTAAHADCAAVLNIATNPLKVHRINEAAVAGDRLLSGGDFIHFGSVHPDAPDAVAECEFIASAGLRGVKFHPDYQHFYVDEERLFPIYDALLSLGLPVIFHGGKDPLSPDDIHCTAGGAARVLRRFPRLKMILAHMGGNISGYRESFELLCGRYENLWLDTSFCVGHIEPELLYKMIERQSADRVLFGSDFPWHTIREELALLRGLGLDRVSEAKILGGNAALLLGLDTETLKR